MPYTPPAQRSPASSAAASPDVSRRSSFLSGSRPPLPHSASYMSKHRRTPSVSAIGNGPANSLTPQATSDDLPSLMGPAVTVPSSNVRQSPPPRTSEHGMPNGAIISPPESPSSGSDEETGSPKSRGRKLERLKHLRDAVSQISQTRTPSPRARFADAEQEIIVASPQTLNMSFSSSTLEDLQSAERKSSHRRSNTEPDASVIKTADTSSTGSEDDTDEDWRQKPQMVRKKSGELVRPALRPPSRRRPSSMPGTPIFSKAVHFDSHLEHVRHFLQVDRPLAVSAGSSPIDAYESETEFPFTTEARPSVRSPPYDWEIVTPSFPHDSATRKALPIKLEKVWLSHDQKSLLGSIAVANLAFQKHVTCRFTFDYWKTTSEVVAEYSHEIRPRSMPIAYDRFTFSVKLSDMANLESKTLLFCLRYAVNGHEYWDNNTLANFQVDFKKRYLPQNGKNNFSGAASKPLNGLPRSNRTHSPSSALRPKSMPPMISDGFGSEPSQFNFDQSIHEYLGESGPTGLRLKTRSINNLASDNIASDLLSPSGVAFANRYDFGASLTAAVQAAKDSMAKEKDGLYMKSNVRGASAPSLGVPSSDVPVRGGSPVGAESNPPNPSLPSLPSLSYEELVNKYCFFGSKQSSPQIEEGTMKGGRFDGSSGIEGERANATSSSLDNVQSAQQACPAASHDSSRESVNPYFQHAFHGVSHATSPLKEWSPAAGMSQSSTPKSAPAAVRSPSPSYLPLTGSPHDAPFHLLPEERFPWAGEAHTATAIRG